MRTILVFAALAVSTLASAQIPDVIVKFDPIFHYRTDREGKTTFRAYDALGNYGTVGLSFTLEPGFLVLVSQRLQTIAGNADDDQLDQIFIEDRGLWRVGKQLMPFGQNHLLRESAYGARFETNLGSDALPASLAACDSGSGRQRGLMGRIGSDLGVSFAVGDRFGIDASSFATLRPPEASPGRNRGFKEVYGGDFSRRYGNLEFSLEHVLLRAPETALDEKTEISDLLITFFGTDDRTISLGWSRDWSTSDTDFRVSGIFPVGGGAWIEPLLLTKSGKVRTFGFSLRVRM